MYEIGLIVAVDEDGSGKIEFDEFLSIMTSIKRGKASSGGNSAMFTFFHSNLFSKSEMSTGQLGEDFDSDLSFRLNVSQFRRRKLLDSIMSENQDKK